MHSQVLEDQIQGRRITPLRSDDDAVRLIELQDGRRLAYTEYGDRSGFPLFYCHNFGSSRLEAALFHRDANRAGFRLISVDRPGVGFSDFKPQGTSLGFAHDLVVLADHLKCTQAGLLCFGGGAIFALAVSHLFPDRIKLLLGVSSVTPASKGPLSSIPAPIANLIFVLTRGLRSIRHSMCARQPLQYLQRLQENLCHADRKLLSDPQVLRRIVADIKESMRQGVHGVAYDSNLQYCDLGFDPGNVHVPVHLWQGGADTLISISHTERFVKTLRNATLYKVPGKGHFFFLRSMSEVFAVARSQLDTRNPHTPRTPHIPNRPSANELTQVQIKNVSSGRKHYML